MKKLPSKVEMKQLSQDLKRKQFACHVETQGTDEHIVRCNWDEAIVNDDGFLFQASVIPTRDYKEGFADELIKMGKVTPELQQKYFKENELRVALSVGMPFSSDKGYTFLQQQYPQIEKELKTRFESRGFKNIRYNINKGYNTPLRIYAEIPLKENVLSQRDDISDFINLNASQIRSKFKWK